MDQNTSLTQEVWDIIIEFIYNYTLLDIPKLGVIGFSNLIKLRELKSMLRHPEASDYMDYVLKIFVGCELDYLLNYDEKNKKIDIYDSKRKLVKSIPSPE